jgi:DNA polymerase
LIDAFRYYDQIEDSDRDVYCQFGDSVYARTITKADEKERFVAKTGVLSLGYQSGANKFYESMRSFGVEDFTRTDAEDVVATYRNLYKQIVAQWETMEHIIRCMVSGQSYKYGPIEVMFGKIRLPNGMFLTYPRLTNSAGRFQYKFGRDWRDIYGGKLTENIVQALARIVMTTAELRLARAGARASLSVHDELIFVIPEQHVDSFVLALRKALTAPVPWMPKLPVNCEIGVGDSYAAAK